MCRSQTFSSVEFLLIKLLSVSVIRKTSRNATRGGREVPILSFLCRAVFGSLWPPGLIELVSIPSCPSRENKDGQRVRAEGSAWPGVQLETFRQNLPSLDTHFTLSSPNSPPHLTFLSKDTLSRPSSLPLLSHPSALFFSPLLSPYMWIVRKWLETMCQFAALYTEALFSSPLTREWLRVVLLYKDSQRKELLFYPITQEWATGKQLVPCSQLPLRLRWGNH